MLLYFSNTISTNCVLKVGGRMNKTEIVKNIIKNNDGIAKTADFIAEGLTNYDVANLCKDGYLERIRHGYYQLAAQKYLKEEQILIAVPRTFSRTRLHIDSLATKIYYIQPDLFEIGKTSGNFNGVQLAVYDRERTICDCFKYRTKLDSEIFNKALNAYAADKKKNLSNLSNYAKKMRVYKKLMDIMEVVLNG